MNLIHDPYQTKSAVLFLIFNRVGASKRVMAQIKAAKPRRLYIGADGSKATREEDKMRCNETRSAVLEMIDWDCEVKTLFRESNLGCKEAVSSAIDWFFEHEEEGIILEDDCLPAQSFFLFCDTLLEKYRTDTRIFLISGCNFQDGKKHGNASYYFSNLTNAWGWASWKRSWKLYDKELARYNENEVRPQLEKIFDEKMVVDRWEEIFKDTKAGNINTWDYQLSFTHFFNHCVNITPNYNLVSNIGFGKDAHNTFDANSLFANVPLQEIKEIIHPKYILPEIEADRRIMLEEFQILRKQADLKKHNSTRRRFKRWSRALFIKHYSSLKACISISFL